MTKYIVKYTGQFKKDYKLAMRQKRDMSRIDRVITLLAQGETLPESNKDHALSGNWKGHRECHVAPDWLLIYKLEQDVLVLTLTRTGSHSALFNE